MSRAAVARQEFLEAIIAGINETVESHEENMRDDPLYGEADFYLWENVHDLKDLNLYGDINETVNEALLTHSRDIILKALKECCEIEVSGIYTMNNSVNSWVLGEQEIQIEELGEILPELTDYEKDYIRRKIEAHWNPKERFCPDCVYTSMDNEVVYAVCEPRGFLKALKKLNRKLI